MTGSGALDLQLVFFQLFFMVIGLAGGVRLVDDLKRWREMRVRKAQSSDA